MLEHLLRCSLIITIALCGCRAEPASTAAAAPPLPSAVSALHPTSAGPTLGVILITVDTLRADYLSCYNHARILTPSFDRLASMGALFSQCFAQATTTTPSHASIMTSLYLQDHNVYSNFDAIGQEPRTLAEVLAGRGFATFAIVNMKHLNPEVSNLGQGFATFVRGDAVRRAGPTIDEFFAWLDKLGEKRFFAWIHFVDVHTPYNPPPPYSHFYYDDDERDPHKRSLRRIWHLLPEHMSDHPLFRAWLEGITDRDWVIAQYQGAVTYVDDEVGRLMDGLAHRGVLDRTAIVLTSDHGEALGEHDMYFVHTGLYEPTSRVPLITYFPGEARRGVSVAEVVESVDIYPTILEHLDVPSPKGIRGRSLLPHLRGEITAQKTAFIEHAGRSLVSLRTGRHKYIRHLRTLHLQPSYPFVEGKEELYDLKLDPYEARDVAGEHQELIQEFRRELTARRAQKLELKTGKAELSPETIEILRSLGYVQ